MRRASSQRAPRGSRSTRVMSRHGAEHERAEQHRRVGERRVEQERQVDGRGEAGPDRERPRRGRRAAPRSTATSAASRQASTRGPSRRARGRPGPRASRPRAGSGPAPLQRDRDRGEEGRQGEPDLEGGPREHQRRRAEAPQGVGHEPAALDEVAGDADVVRGVLGLGEDDDRRRDDADGERDGEHGQRPSARPRAGVIGRGQPRTRTGCRRLRAHRVDATSSVSRTGGPTHAGRWSVDEDLLRGRDAVVALEHEPRMS